MDLIDTSTLSLSIGGVVAVLTLLLAKYFLDRRNNTISEEEKMDNSSIWLYSIAVGIGLGAIALVLYKQFLVYQSNTNLLTENFYN